MLITFFSRDYQSNILLGENVDQALESESFGSEFESLLMEISQVKRTLLVSRSFRIILQIADSISNIGNFVLDILHLGLKVVGGLDRWRLLCRDDIDHFFGATLLRSCVFLWRGSLNLRCLVRLFRRGWAVLGWTGTVLLLTVEALRGTPWVVLLLSVAIALITLVLGESPWLLLLLLGAFLLGGCCPWVILLHLLVVFGSAILVLGVALRSAKVLSVEALSDLSTSPLLGWLLAVALVVSLRCLWRLRDAVSLWCRLSPWILLLRLLAP